MTTNIPIIREGETPNLLHGIKALVGICNILNSLTPEIIAEHAKNAANGFALIDAEKQAREDFIKICSDAQTEKNAALRAKSEAEALNESAKFAMNDISIKSQELLERENAHAIAKKNLNDKEQALIERENQLNSLQGNISTGEALLADKMKAYNDKEISLSMREAAVNSKQAEIESLLGKIK